MDRLIEDICFLNPQPEEIIILYYRDGAPLYELEQTYNILGNSFPNNKIIALNRSLCLSVIERDNLINFLKG